MSELNKKELDELVEKHPEIFDLLVYVLKKGGIAIYIVTEELKKIKNILLKIQLK